MFRSGHRVPRARPVASGGGANHLLHHVHPDHGASDEAGQPASRPPQAAPDVEDLIGWTRPGDGRDPLDHLGRAGPVLGPVPCRLPHVDVMEGPHGPVLPAVDAGKRPLPFRRTDRREGPPRRPSTARRRSALPDLPIPQEVARVPLPTAAGQFDARAFQGRSGLVYLATMIMFILVGPGMYSVDALICRAVCGLREGAAPPPAPDRGSPPLTR